MRETHAKLRQALLDDFKSVAKSSGEQDEDIAIVEALVIVNVVIPGGEGLFTYSADSLGEDMAAWKKLGMLDWCRDQVFSDYRGTRRTYDGG